MAQPINDNNLIDKLKRCANTLKIEVNEGVTKTNTDYVDVVFNYNSENESLNILEGYHLNGRYSFYSTALGKDNSLEIDDTTSLNPKNLSIDDVTILEIINPHLSKELLHMYLMIKDLLDNKINVEDLVDNMRDYVYSLSK